jgi:hypothetical protein
MGVQLMVEVLDHAPVDWTPSERLAVVAIAEWVRDGTRRGCPPVELIAHRAGIDVESLSRTMRRLAGKGWELRVPTGVDRKGRTVYAHRGHRTVFEVPRLCPRGEHSTQACATWASEDVGRETEGADERPDHRPAIATQGDGERPDHRPANTPDSPDQGPPIDPPAEGERPDHRPAKVGERPDHRPLKAGPPSGPSPQSPQRTSPHATPSPAKTEPPITQQPADSTRSESVTEPPTQPAANGGPVIYSPKPPVKTARNGAKHRQPTLIPKTAGRLPEALRIIVDDLRARGHANVTRDDAEHVRKNLVAQYGSKVTVGYLQGIANGSGFDGYYADLRKARADAVNSQIIGLAETQPECEHGTAAGRTPHPITGRLLCPMCRSGAPARADTGPTTPPAVAAAIDAYRRNYRGVLRADQLVVLTQQATGLAAQGASTDALAALAERAAAAGIALFVAATQGGTTP